MKPPKIGAHLGSDPTMRRQRPISFERRTAQAATLACLLLVGCDHQSGVPASPAPRLPPSPTASAPAVAQKKEYGFIHHETTGVMSAIVIGTTSNQAPGRTEETIIFSKDSTPDAIESLFDLDPRVLLPNADGSGIVVVGVLDNTVRHTISGPGMADSEPYREFRLSRWYLRAPFVRWLREATPAYTDPGVTRDTRLRPEDFGGRVPGDLSRFVQAR